VKTQTPRRHFVPLAQYHKHLAPIRSVLSTKCCICERLPNMICMRPTYYELETDGRGDVYGGPSQVMKGVGILAGWDVCAVRGWILGLTDARCHGGDNNLQCTVYGSNANQNYDNNTTKCRQASAWQAGWRAGRRRAVHVMGKVYLVSGRRLGEWA
jgi:hypothetical protein